MPDNFNSAYLASRRERQRPEMDAMLTELDQMAQADAAPQPAPAAPAPAPKKDSPGVVGEGFKAVAGGVTDAVRNTWNLVDDAATWLDNNFLDLRVGSSSFGQAGGATKPHQESLQIPSMVSPNQTTGGRVARSLTQFVVPFLGATKALRYAAPVMGRAGATIEGSAAVRGATAGAATDMAAFDPNDKRLSNLILDMTDNNPAIAKPVFEYLAADPSDSHMEGRFKNTLEGLGLGMAVEGVFKGFKAVRSHYNSKGQNPAEAIQKAADEARAEELKAPELVGPKQPTLAEQIELLTGVNNPGSRSKWDRRLDANAAFKGEADNGLSASADYGKLSADEAGQKSPEEFMQGGRELALEDPNAIPFSKPAEAPVDIPIGDQFKLVEESIKKGDAHRVMFDPQEGSIILTKDAPSPTQIDLDTRVKVLLDKPTTERTAEDLITLRAYRQLQETAFPGIIKPGEATPAGKPLAVDASSGTGKAAFTDAERAAMRETPAKAPAEPAAASKGADEGVAPVVGDTVFYGAGKGSGELVKLLKNGRAMIRDDASGALKTVTLDEADPLLEAVVANSRSISSALGQQQGGYVTPSMLANLVAAQAGGAAGFMSADDDASMAEKLSMAGVGLLAGLGVKVGAAKVLTSGERALIETPHPDVVSLARKEVANIAPFAATAKKVPVIHASKVAKLVEAAKSGDFESLARAAKESDFNFSRIDTQEDVKETIDAFSSVFEKETSLAKHGVQTDAQLKALAGELGAGVDSLKTLYQNTENLGARILAHRALLTASAEKVTSLSRMALSGDGDAILSLRKQVALHASIQAEMKGVQTEVARALAQFRITSTSIDLAVNERNQLIDAMGGHAANIRFAQQLADITDPAKLNAVIRKGVMARNGDALYEAWVNGLLSSPVTHAVNAVGNSLVAIGSIAERGTAAMIGKVLRTGPEGVRTGEVKAQLFGMAEGLLDAVRITKEGLDAAKRAAGEAVQGNFGEADRIIRDNSAEFGNGWKAFATDMPVIDNAAYATREFDKQTPAISVAALEHLGIDPHGFTGRFADGLGALIRTPGRLLTTSDEIFKTIHIRGATKAQAYRMAVSEGREGDDLFRRVAELVEDPTPELRALSLKAAREGTFTAPLGESGAALQNYIQKTPGARYIMPFVRTPTNIIKYVGTRTPLLNLMADSVRAEFAAGGARRDMMLAKTTMGAALYSVGAYLAAQGLIVGGGERDHTAEKLSGAIPYSVKIGDTYYAFNRADPFGMFLGLAADMADISGHLDDTEADELAAAAVLSLSRNLASKSYLSGVTNLVEAISSPERKFDKAIEGFIASWVPAVVNQVRKEVDPEVKEVWSVMDAVKARIPGFSSDVPPQVNVFGEDVKLRGGLGPDMVSPFMTSEASTDPAATEIARLNLDLRIPPKTIGGSNGAPGVDLDHKQYYRLLKLSGNEAKINGKGFRDAVSELIQSERYKALPEDPSNTLYPEAKERTIKLLHEAYKKQATGLLLQEDADLRSKFVQNKQNSANALKGAPILPF